MALRAVPDHPKFAALKATLGLPKGAALGWLEAMWHFTGRFTPHGNIGKYTDGQIEAWLEWDGESGALISAFVSCGWIDIDSEYRLLTHDWHIHADNATKLAVSRSKKPFCLHSVSTVSPQCVETVEEIATVCGLPGPGAGAEPVPDPEPVPEGTLDASLENAKLLYQLYPKHVGKGKAMPAIQRALRKVDFDTLRKRVQEFAKQRKGQDEQFTPHPATWFSQERWEDESLRKPEFVVLDWDSPEYLAHRAQQEAEYESDF